MNRNNTILALEALKNDDGGVKVQLTYEKAATNELLLKSATDSIFRLVLLAAYVGGMTEAELLELLLLTYKERKTKQC